MSGWWSGIVPHSPRLPVAIATRGLTKRYGERCVVDHLDFTVPTGVVCGFVGPNGAGKTTTIRMLLGLVAPSEGTATLLGHPLSEPAAYLPRVGALIEGPAFYPSLSGRRNLEVLARLGRIDRARIDEVLGSVGLAHRAHDRYRSYSMGMKQRLGIAAALLGDPDLLVLDEPTNGLDPPGIRELRALLCALAAGGTTVFVSSHLLDELQHVCDHLVVIDQGRLVFNGAVDDLLGGSVPQLGAVPEDLAMLPELVRLCEQEGRAATAIDGRVLVEAPLSWAGELNRMAMRNGITLCTLAVVPTRLEDAFFHLTDSTLGSVGAMALPGVPPDSLGDDQLGGDLVGVVAP
jgi:ABC-2 type transport system ATP-binding protein